MYGPPAAHAERLYHPLDMKIDDHGPKKDESSGARGKTIDKKAHSTSGMAYA